MRISTSYIASNFNEKPCMRPLLNRNYRKNKNGFHALAERMIKTKYNALSKIQEALREGDGLAGEYQWARLYELVRFFEIMKPSTVLEFGSGGSSFTYQIGHQSTTVTSVDNSVYWQEKAKILDTDNKINWKICPCIVRDDGEEITTSYNFEYQTTDFVYIDGPVNHAKYFQIDSSEYKLLSDMSRIRDKSGHAPNIDIVSMWKQNIFPSVIAVDGRRSTIRYLLEHNYADYQCILKSDFMIYNSFISNPSYKYHTWFIKDKHDYKHINNIIRNIYAI